MSIETSAGAVKQVYVGSTPVKAVYVGAQKVWPVDPRTVTIRRSSTIGQWDQGSATGDVSLIQEWVGNDRVVFVAAVTCDQTVYSSDSHVTQPSGTVLRAGAEIRSVGIPTVYTFTEVL